MQHALGSLQRLFWKWVLMICTDDGPCPPPSTPMALLFWISSLSSTKVLAARFQWAVTTSPCMHRPDTQHCLFLSLVYTEELLDLFLNSQGLSSGSIVDGPLPASNAGFELYHLLSLQIRVNPLDCAFFQRDFSSPTTLKMIGQCLQRTLCTFFPLTH